MQEAQQCFFCERIYTTEEITAGKLMPFQRSSGKRLVLISGIVHEFYVSSSQYKSPAESNFQEARKNAVGLPKPTPEVVMEAAPDTTTESGTS
jgi:hypothetical protein